MFIFIMRIKDYRKSEVHTLIIDLLFISVLQHSYASANRVNTSAIQFIRNVSETFILYLLSTMQSAK